MTTKSHITDALELAGLLRPSWPDLSRRIAASGVPTCEVAEASLADKLKGIEAELSDAREENAVLKRERDRTRSEFAKSPGSDPSSAVFKQAERATQELADSDRRVKDLQQVQVGVLKMMGRGPAGSDGNGPRSGGDYFGNAWEQAARELSLADGRTRIDTMADRMLPAAAVKVTPGEGLAQPSYMAPFAELGLDQRFLFPSFPRTSLERHELAIWDFRQKGERTVTGEVERDPVATTEKATLDLEVELETPSLRQFAVVIEGVPVKLLESEDAMLAFLQNEAKYQLNLAVDRHCLAQITAATPPHGKTGATLIERARNAVSAMRAQGAQPSVLALSPTDAAALDTQKTGTAGLEQYVFGAKDTGSASPLWGLQVLELPHIEKPTLIDPALFAALYTATGVLLIDPYTGLSTNTVRLRMEAEALLHVRDAAGAYVIE